MVNKKDIILTINGGSSSIKFAFFIPGHSLIRLLHGQVDRIGTPEATLEFTNDITQEESTIKVHARSYLEAATVLIEWLEKQYRLDSINAIGHRIVHGMQHTEPERITTSLLKELRTISQYDPEHLPEEIKLIELFQKHCPQVIQIACFDTSFHSSMPVVAKMAAIPRRYYNKGVMRYGFHGLSYGFLMQELANVDGEEAAQGKIVLAHLGSGASLAAIKAGKSIDTSMGFTPSSGLPMGTRSGDLDPGIAWYLMKLEKLTPNEFSHLVNHESGLLGISETSPDVRSLLLASKTDVRASEAIELFCYQTKKWIGSFAAVLDGIDTLVFSGGIGEHSSEIRHLICKDLTFLGLELDEEKNDVNESIISSGTSRVTVRVIPTNEELMIARTVQGIVNN